MWLPILISLIWPIFFLIMSNVMWPILLTRRQTIEFNEDFRIHWWWWMNRPNMFDKLTESCFDKRVMLLPKTFILLSGPLNFEPATLKKKKAVRKVNYRLNTWKIAEKTSLTCGFLLSRLSNRCRCKSTNVSKKKLSIAGDFH